MKIELIKRDMNEIRDIIKNSYDKSLLLCNLKKKGYKINHVGFETIDIENKNSKYNIGRNRGLESWYLLDHLIIKGNDDIHGFCFVELFDIESLYDDTYIRFPFNYGINSINLKLSDERVTI